ncbi:MAG: hypothetical protein ACTHOO_10685 [Alcanivorax sp.]
MQVTPVIFEPILRVFKFFYDCRSDNKKHRLEMRRKAYDDHFITAFEKMEKIHINYMKSFHEFVDICLEMKTPNHQLLREFRRYGIEYSHWREGVRNFSKTASSLAENFSDEKEKAAIEEFVKSIDEYFQASIYDRHYRSWFSGFLSVFEDQVKAGISPWDYDYSRIICSGDDPKITFINSINRVCKDVLPQNWKNICIAHDNIRSVFCQYS